MILKTDEFHFVYNFDKFESSFFLMVSKFSFRPNIDKLGIGSMFVAQEIFSSWTHKTDHFQRIHSRTGVPFKSMLFFDDEDRNIETVSKMGVTSVLVDNGVNLGALRQGLTNYAQNVNKIEKNKKKWIKYTQNSTSSEKTE